MGYRVYQFGTQCSVDMGGPRHFICDSQSDRPTSNLRKKDTAYTTDDGKTWEASSETTWVETSWAGGSSEGESTGVIKAFGGTSAPTGYLLCDGAAVSRTTYSALFAVIGTKFGAGDGSTTFNVPNGKGRTLVGVDSSIPDFDDVGKSGGAKTVELTTAEMPSHTHAQDAHNHTQDAHNHTQDAHTHVQNSHNHTQDPHNHTQDPHTHIQNAHSHVQQVNSATTGGLSGYTPDTSTNTGVNSGYSTASATPTNQNTTATNQAATATNQAATATNQNATATNQAATATNQAATATNQNTGGGGAHENMPPYLVANWIIKT